jgi:hypothetical protein
MTTAGATRAVENLSLGARSADLFIDPVQSKELKSTGPTNARIKKESLRLLAVSYPAGATHDRLRRLIHSNGKAIQGPSRAWIDLKRSHAPPSPVELALCVDRVDLTDEVRAGLAVLGRHGHERLRVAGLHRVGNRGEPVLHEGLRPHGIVALRQLRQHRSNRPRLRRRGRGRGLHRDRRCGRRVGGRRATTTPSRTHAQHSGNHGGCDPTYGHVRPLPESGASLDGRRQQHRRPQGRCREELLHRPSQVRRIARNAPVPGRSMT